MAVSTICEVHEVSRKATYSRDGLTVTRVLDVYPFSQAAPLAYEMLGGPRYANGRIFRRLPERDPWLPQCFVENIESEGMGVFSGTVPKANNASVMLASKNIYTFARLTVTYKTPEKATPEEREASEKEDSTEKSEIDLASQTFDFSGQSMTIPTTFMQWKNGAVLNPVIRPEGSNSIKILPRIEYALQRHEVASRPLIAITSLVGRVNKSPFNLGVAVWPAETLRFDGANISQKVTSEGFKFFDINYKFCIQPIYDYVATTPEVVGNDGTITTASKTALAFVGWNRAYRWERGYWDYMRESKSVKFRGLYLYDEDVFQGNIKGFKLLFNPRAI